MPYRVLIVDDQKGVSRLLRSALETIERGLIVMEAPSGEEAILEASRTKIDLLIADFRLPGINGMELQKKYRLLNPAGKVIMISGVTDPMLKKMIAEAKPEAFFAKPVPMGDFLDAVESCLGMARTILHPTETSEVIPPQPEKRLGLGDILVGLRKSLNAQAVLLYNDQGQIVAEAGQMTGADNNVALVSALMSLFSSAQKAASLIDHAGSHLHLFSGGDLDGIFMPVGTTHALLLVGKGLADAHSLSIRLDSLFAARQEMKEALKNLGVQPQTEPVLPKPVLAINEPHTRPEDLPSDFLSIFSQIGKKTEDADSFWNSAIEDGTTFSEPDKLTFEQASRLGLAPGSAQEK